MKKKTLAGSHLLNIYHTVMYNVLMSKGIAQVIYSGNVCNIRCYMLHVFSLIWQYYIDRFSCVQPYVAEYAGLLKK